MSDQQEWAEAVIECVSDNAERERLIRMYDYDELVKACLALGTLALTAKTEYQRAERLRAELEAARRDAANCDKDWVLAIAAAIGPDSGYNIPIVPEPESFRELFAFIKESK